MKTILDEMKEELIEVKTKILEELNKENKDEYNYHKNVHKEQILEKYIGKLENKEMSELINNPNVVDLMVISHEEGKKHGWTFAETKEAAKKYFKIK